MNYRRIYTPNSFYFFTLVTYQRKPIFNNSKNILLLKEVFKETKLKYPFRLDAISIMPDHLHCIWQMHEEDSDYSKRWNVIKGKFSRRISKEFKGSNTRARIKKREQPVWQRRFWEHRIRSEKDYHNHLDYIHYNPVKHGLSGMAKDWPYSSFSNFVSKGYYDENWGVVDSQQLQGIGME